MKVQIQTRSGRSLGEYLLTDDADLAELSNAFHTHNMRYYPSRQRFTFPHPPGAQPNTRAAPVRAGPSLTAQAAARGLSMEGLTLTFKDLGPQVPWRTVFIVEYLGPLLLFPALWAQPEVVYGADAPGPTQLQTIAAACFVVHYLKREIETLFVHRFSNATMPMKNIVKNTVYYWGFALWMGYFICHPLFTPPPHLMTHIGLALFASMELLNFVSHVQLRNLRPPGTRVRRIPTGPLFALVSCPNYLFEILAWVGFNLMTNSLVGWVFCAVGAAQMLLWAKGKHRMYKKEFDGMDGRELYPEIRKALIPFVI
mmetsp:Transcript_17888/g.45397  ORF Transcript_17888/g.45397 Transcript_17888/m.45397 type:complete len:312 (-) Transcript_17888:491-1426(-)